VNRHLETRNRGRARRCVASGVCHADGSRGDRDHRPPSACARGGGGAARRIPDPAGGRRWHRPCKPRVRSSDRRREPGFAGKVLPDAPWLGCCSSSRSFESWSPPLPRWASASPAACSPMTLPRPQRVILSRPHTSGGTLVGIPALDTSLSLTVRDRGCAARAWRWRRCCAGAGVGAGAVREPGRLRHPIVAGSPDTVAKRLMSRGFLDE
jgi:hypothetical protein